jgi:pyroglutamyl-peptidase
MRVLLTAFEPYGEWSTNSSWLTLVELLRQRPPNNLLVTRRYPVDFARMQTALYKDLSQNYDAVLHLGQAPGSAIVRLETFAVNAGGVLAEDAQKVDRLVLPGPEAYRTRMPVDRWAEQLRELSIPAQVSYHAGTYLCNAIMYLSHHWIAQAERLTPVGFIHLPLTTQQVASSAKALPCLPVETLAQAVSKILEEIEMLPTADVVTSL